LVDSLYSADDIIGREALLSFLIGLPQFSVTNMYCTVNQGSIPTFVALVQVNLTNLV